MLIMVTMNSYCYSGGTGISPQCCVKMDVSACIFFLILKYISGIHMLRRITLNFEQLSCQKENSEGKKMYYSGILPIYAINF